MSTDNTDVSRCLMFLIDDISYTLIASSMHTCLFCFVVCFYYYYVVTVIKLKVENIKHYGAPQADAFVAIF